MKTSLFILLLFEYLQVIAQPAFPALKHYTPLTSVEHYKSASGQLLDSVITCAQSTSTSPCVRSRKIAYAYDTNEQIDKVTLYLMDNNGEWIEDYQADYTYSANGKVIQQVSYSWDNTTNQWVENLTVDYSYNTSNNIYQLITSSWATANNQWESSTKYTFQYNTTGKLTQQIHYSWNNALFQWKESSKIESIYNNDNYKIEEIHYTWESSNNQWKNSTRESYLLDHNNQRVEVLSYFWEDINNQWKETLKVENTFSNEGCLVQALFYDWNNNQWELSSSQNQNFDANGNTSSIVDYSRNNNQWIGEEKRDFIYDANGFVTRNTYYNWNLVSNTWDFDRLEQHTLYYQPTVNLHYLPSQDLAQLYPNPVTNHLQIETQANTPLHFQLTDLQGRVLLNQTWTGQQSQSIDLSHLAQGLYLYTILVDDKRQTGKLVKQ